MGPGASSELRPRLDLAPRAWGQPVGASQPAGRTLYEVTTSPNVRAIPRTSDQTRSLGLPPSAPSLGPSQSRTAPSTWASPGARANLGVWISTPLHPLPASPASPNPQPTSPLPIHTSPPEPWPTTQNSPGAHVNPVGIKTQHPGNARTRSTFGNPSPRMVMSEHMMCHSTGGEAQLDRASLPAPCAPRLPSPSRCPLLPPSTHTTLPPPTPPTPNHPNSLNHTPHPLHPTASHLSSRPAKPTRPREAQSTHKPPRPRPTPSPCPLHRPHPHPHPPRPANTSPARPRRPPAPASAPIAPRPAPPHRSPARPLCLPRRPPPRPAPRRPARRRRALRPGPPAPCHVSCGLCGLPCKVEWCPVVYVVYRHGHYRPR